MVTAGEAQVVSANPGGPYDHSNHLDGPGTRWAGVLQPGAAGVSGVPGRVFRPDPRGLRASPASVRDLVSPPPAGPVQRFAALTSNGSAATSKPSAGPEPRSPGGCAPSPGSTSTPSKKNSSTTPRPCTSAVRGWTTNPT